MQNHKVQRIFTLYNIGLIPQFIQQHNLTTFNTLFMTPTQPKINLILSLFIYYILSITKNLYIFILKRCKKYLKTIYRYFICA